MQTCKLMHCANIGNCHLEENGAIDLCPVLQAIKDEVKAKTERTWAAKYSSHEIVPLEHYQGTRTTVAVGFTLQLGLKRIAYLELARREATLKTAEFMNKHKLNPVEPRPEPKKVVPEKSDLDFHEMPTLTNDYCAYAPLEHVEDMEAKELKAKERITKLQKRRWQDYNAKKKIRARRIKDHHFFIQMEDNIRNMK